MEIRERQRRLRLQRTKDAFLIGSFDVYDISETFGKDSGTRT